MDFAFTDEEEGFRAELRAFLAEELPAWWRGMFVDDPRALPFTRAFCAKLAARGWLTMAWPRAYGGQDASPWKQAILREEMWAHEEPRGPQYMNLNYIGPCVMRFGSEAQKRRFLPSMAAGAVVWTQGFSEPGAGSDLAAIATRAEERGDHFVVDGQKTWNSYADAPADWCFLLARTTPGAARHAGLSVLLVDMRTPGITVRPIGSMAGPHELNEIFFDGVRVPGPNGSAPKMRFGRCPPAPDNALSPAITGVNGKPDCKAQIPDICHPPAMALTSGSAVFRKGNS